ncbi:MAG: glutaredoxin family protein [Gammaproteobacteria bacterium]
MPAADRESPEQTVPEQTVPEHYVLYQYASCPFCQRVLRFLAQAGVELPLKDTLRDPAARRELIQGGGDSQVPCLRIERSGEVTWLYESLDIIAYLQAQLGNRLPARDA